MANSRNKGASFEREIANLLTADLGLEKNIRRILAVSYTHLTLPTKA